jgi:hypothetical protein
MHLPDRKDTVRFKAGTSMADNIAGERASRLASPIIPPG